MTSARDSETPTPPILPAVRLDYVPDPAPGGGTIAGTASPVVIAATPPNIWIRVLWFLFVGWWAGPVIAYLAWVAIVLIVGLPLGLWLINRLPTVMTLRPQEQDWTLMDGILRQGKPQRPLILRALWFLLVGWWLSGLWMLAAFVMAYTIIGLPVAFVMFGRIGAVTTLYRS